MPRFFVKKEQVKKTTIEILGEDIKHIKNVLRLTIGEKIEICEKSENPSKLKYAIKILRNHIYVKLRK